MGQFLMGQFNRGRFNRVQANWDRIDRCRSDRGRNRPSHQIPMSRVGSYRTRREGLASHHQGHQSPFLDLLTLLVEQLSDPMDLAMPTTMRLKVHDFRDGSDGIAWENRLAKTPIANFDQGGRLHKRSRGAESRQNRHSQHPVRDGLTEGSLAGEFLIGVQPIVVPCQLRKLLNIANLDRSRFALPSISDAQIFESKAACMGDHR